MQALEIVVPGEFYDSQIYDGRLYLWSISGSLILIDWNLLVERIRVSEELRIALKFALQYGDNLYNNLLMQDPEVRKIMESKFQKLSKLRLEVKRQDLEQCIVSQQDSPLPFPHADSTIHYKTMYIAGQSGVSASRCSVGRGRKQVVEIANKLFDLPVLSLSASHLTLAVAAGSEGLFDYSLIPTSDSGSHNNLRELSKNHCNLARWLYPSIFASSYFNDGYFADFKRKERSKTKQKQLSQKIVQLVLSDSSEISELEEDESQRSTSQYRREFTRLISSQEIFARDTPSASKESTSLSGKKFTWGVQDKICLATKNSIKLVQYSPQNRANSQRFRDIGSVDIQELNSEVISADSSFFGVILEQEDGLLVIGSSLETYFFDGEPVNWRVFPKSRNYINQLHVIYDNSLCIYSFNHDYFVDQNTKKLGISAASIEK